jgi:hypothetical protein
MGNHRTEVRPEGMQFVESLRSFPLGSQKPCALRGDAPKLGYAADRDNHREGQTEGVGGGEQAAPVGRRPQVIVQDRPGQEHHRNEQPATQ